jgi:hypothetical protein
LGAGNKEAFTCSFTAYSWRWVPESPFHRLSYDQKVSMYNWKIDGDFEEFDWQQLICNMNTNNDTLFFVPMRIRCDAYLQSIPPCFDSYSMIYKHTPPSAHLLQPTSLHTLQIVRCLNRFPPLLPQRSPQFPSLTIRLQRTFDRPFLIAREINTLLRERNLWLQCR